MDRVHRSYKERSHWMCVPDVNEPLVYRATIIDILITLLAFGTMLFVVVLLIAMFIFQM